MEAPPEKVNNRNRLRRLRWPITFIVVASTLTGIYWLLVLRYRVSTDNAYVVADSARISSRVPGTVMRVLVENDEPVQKGQMLLELDRRDYQTMVDQARGAVAGIEADMRATEISITLTDTQTVARLQEATAKLQQALENKREGLHKLEELEKKRLGIKADLTMARRDFKRFSSLYGSGAISEEQRDRAHTSLVKAEAQLQATDAELAAVKASLQAIDQEVEQQQANLQAAQGDRYQVEVLNYKLAALQGQRQETEAMLRAAQLNLSYCTVVAPIPGYIAQKSAQVGDRVQPGQALMAVVPLQDAYVEANFKETQLKDVRLGQPATIEADIYPDYLYHGKVVGIRAGTGAAFSLLPAENATGNWIKVVQRIPVRISLDEVPPADHPLRVGSSLQVTISTRDRRGRVLVPLAAKL